MCYSGDSVGSVAVYFCTDGYSLEGDTTRECLSSGLWNGSTPQCVETIKGELKWLVEHSPGLQSVLGWNQTYSSSFSLDIVFDLVVGLCFLPHC